LPKQDWIVIGWVLAIKVLLFVVAAKSYPILWNSHLNGARRWFEIWDQWDFGYYREIAESGYNSGDGSLAFYPLFPWLLRLVAYVCKSYFFAGLIVSGIASIVAAVLFRRLVQLDYTASVALRSVWFLLIFPTAYFLHVGYSESLFLAMALGSILAARVERWWLAGVLGVFCWMTRGVGAVLVPTLAVEAAQQYWMRRKFCSHGAVSPCQNPEGGNASAQRGDYNKTNCSAWNWKWLWIAIVPTGFVVYLLINWRVAGHPFAFLQTRKVSFEQWFALPSAGIRQAIWALYPSAREAEMVGAQEMFFVALGFVCTIVSWIKLRPAYATWITGNLILFSSVNFLQSVPRTR
jgi:Mannosyltransferase (PIG-V)